MVFNNRKDRISYIYNAIGQKVAKVVTENSTITKTHYLAGGFQYKNNVLQFFPQAEGYVKKEANNYSYVFNYTDHLGNIRLSYTDMDNSGTIDIDEIIEENEYYPFGLKHESHISSNAYQMKYNGKELQTELGLNMYDMDMRDYDPAIARWVVIDPVVHYDYSPYNAFDNNPVFWADPSGADSQMPSWMRDLWERSRSGITTWNAKGDGSFQEGDPKKRVRIVLNLGGGADIDDAAMTRAEQIRKNNPNDLLIYIDDNNLGNLKNNIESMIKGYGMTIEFSVFGHNANDGPKGGYYEDNQIDLSKKTGSDVDKGQITLDDWMNIDYNFDTKSSVAAFYGCNTASWAETFLETQKKVKYTVGVAGRAGGTRTVKGEFKSTISNHFGIGTSNIYMRSQEGGQVLPLFIYTRGSYESGTGGYRVLKERYIYGNATVN